MCLCLCLVRILGIDQFVVIGPDHKISPSGTITLAVTIAHVNTPVSVLHNTVMFSTPQQIMYIYGNKTYVLQNHECIIWWYD